MKRIVRIWFDGDWLCGEDEGGKVYRQSVLWYWRLADATPEQRNDYELSHDGMHWRCVDEDIGMDSFAERDGVEPNAMQRFFLTHREHSIAEWAKILGLSPVLLRNYINGWETPSPRMVADIRSGIRHHSRAFAEVDF